MTMDSARWARLSALFDQAIDLPAEDREAFLVSIHREDAELGMELARMLTACDVQSPLDSHGRAPMDRDADVDDASPVELGGWQVEHELGRGGTGIVYAAHRDDGDTGQRSAIKHMHRRWDGSMEAQRFLHERRILARLTHSNIPRLIDHGVDREGRPWFAQEFIEGLSLVQWADAHRLTLRERLDLFRKVCAAVQHAHEHFIVHRDLKPANILIDADGQQFVLDFGAAKRVNLLEGVTHTGAFAGFTPEYAAPEQINGGTISASTDVYALGAILYQLLSGQLPCKFEGHKLHEASSAIMHQAPIPLERALATADPAALEATLTARQATMASYRRSVHGDLWKIVQTALAKEPERRYSSVANMSADILRYLQGRPVSVMGDTFGYRARRFVQRNRWGVAMGSLAALAILAGVVLVSWQALRARQQAEMAVRMKDAVIDVVGQAGVAGDDRQRARAMLDAGTQHLQGLPQGSVFRSELGEALARMLFTRGYMDSVVKLLSAELAPRLSGVSAPEAREHEDAMLELYAVALQRQGQFATARKVLHAVLADTAAVEPATQANLYAQLTSIELADNHPDAALVAATRAIEIRRILVPAGDPMPWQRMVYAAALTASRHGEEARALSERVLREVGTQAKPETQIYVNTMAALRRSLFGDFQGADALHQKSMSIAKGMGEGASEFFWFSYAVNLFDLGRIDEAQDVVVRLELLHANDNGDDASAGYAGLAELRWLRGEIELAKGDNAVATRAFADGASRLSRAQGASAHQRVYLDALHSIAAREQAPDEADAALARAQAGINERGVAGSYAQAMTLAAQGRKLKAAGDARAAAEAFEQATATLQKSRKLPLVLEFQLKENRDERRYRAWMAQVSGQAGGTITQNDDTLQKVAQNR